MDAMYRRKNAKAQEQANVSEGKREKKHADEGYAPKVRPRETHPDSVYSKKRIKKRQVKYTKPEQHNFIRKNVLYN
jgi:hypothetical protein